MIDVDGVSVSLGDVDVLEDVSLAAPDGRLVGLVGPNGAGKTTLLRTISGAIDPDAGRVTVDGDDVHELSSRAASRSISVVPQDTTLSFSFDVRDVVAMGRTPHRGRFSPPTAEDREHVEQSLDRTRTRQFADRSITEVSGGERQRVILARAIAQDTPAVLLDEPTSSLDVNHAIETMELVEDLVADGKTVVAAIHDLNLAARYCDELVVLADGDVLVQGPPERVLTGSRIERAFDTRAAVSVNPVTWTPSVTAVSEAGFPDELPERVHLVGSGQGGADAITTLVGADVRCTVGPVPDGDAVDVTARQLDVDRITVEPYEPVGADALDAFERRIADAAVTVLADVRSTGGADAILERLDGRSAVVVESRYSNRGADHRAPPSDRYQAIRRNAVLAEPPELLEAVAAVSGTTTGRSERPNEPPDSD